MDQLLKPTLSSERIHLIVFFILALYPLVGMGIDLIAPSLPAISTSLNTSKMFSKNLITIYLLGYAVGSFCSGFLSDAWGRRRLIIAGFILFIISSLLPTYWSSVSVLLIARLLQGITLGFFSVIGRAVLADLLSPTQLVRIGVIVSMMWGIGPIIGPVIGGYLQFYFGWTACFYFFAIMGLISLIIFFIFIPETHFNRHPLNITHIKNNFILIISNKIFMGIVILMGLTYSLLIVFNTLGPFLIQQTLNHTSIYFGHLALFMGCVFLLATITCRLLMQLYDAIKIILFSILFFFLMSFVMGVISYYEQSVMWVIASSTVLMFIDCGIVYGACMGKAISLFKHIAGSSIAMMILINISLTSVTSFMMSFIHANNAFILCAIYFVLMLLSVVVFFGVVRDREQVRES